MAAKYILASLAVVFLCAGGFRVTRPERSLQGRAWLIVGVLLGAVSGWLFVQG
jgi:hypothetical protein